MNDLLSSYQKFTKPDVWWKVFKRSVVDFNHYHSSFKHLVQFDSIEWDRFSQSNYVDLLIKDNLLQSNKPGDELTSNARGYKKVFEQLGLCYTDEIRRIHISEAGKFFHNYDGEKLLFKTEQLIKFNYQIDDCYFNPKIFLLELLMAIDENYISADEFRIFVTRAHKQNQYEEVKKLIYLWRELDANQKSDFVKKISKTKKTNRGSTDFKKINSYSSYAFIFFGESILSFINEIDDNKILSLKTDKIDLIKKILNSKKDYIYTSENNLKIFRKKTNYISNLLLKDNKKKSLKNINSILFEELSHEDQKNMFLPVEYVTSNVRAINILKVNKIKYLGDILQNYALIEQKKLYMLGETTKIKILNSLKLLSIPYSLNVLDWDKTKIVKRTYYEKITEKEKFIDSRNKQIKLMSKYKCLEDQVSNVLNEFNYKRIDVVKFFYGVDGTGKKTLEETGKKFGCTREYARQVVAKFNYKFKKAFKSKPTYFVKISDFLNQNIPIEKKTCEKMLFELNFVKKGFNISSFLSMYELLKTKKQFFLFEFNNFLILDKISVSGSVFKKTNEFFKKNLNKQPFYPINLMSKSLGVDTRQIKNVINATDNIDLLENKWVYLSDINRNRIYNILLKIFNVKKTLNLRHISKAVKRVDAIENIDDDAIPFYCKKVFNAEISDNKIIADPKFIKDHYFNQARKVFTDNDKKILSLFNEKKLYTFEQIHTELVNLGINRSTAPQLVSGKTPILIREALGIYTLVGTEFYPGEIDEFISTNKNKSQHLVDYDYLSDVSIVLKYPMTDKYMTGKYFAIPKTLKKIVLNGSYNVLGTSNLIKIKNGYISNFSNANFSQYFKKNYELNFIFNLKDKNIKIKLEKSNFIYD